MKKMIFFLFWFLLPLWVVISPKASEMEAQKHFDNALKLYNLGNYDRAIDEFTEVIKIDPKFDRAYTNRGILWMEKGEYDRAIEDCTHAMELNPNQFQAYSCRGNAWRYKGEYDRAISDHTKAVELNPQNARIYNNRGAVWINRGEYDRAVADFTKAIELDPKYPMPYYNRGNSLYCQGKFKEAIPDYQKALERNYTPKDYPYLMLLLAQRKGSPEEYEKERKEFLRFVTSHSTYGWIRKIIVFCLEENVNEQQILMEALRGGNEKQKKERSCEAYYYLGEQRLSKGDRKGAEEYFRQSVATLVFTTAEYQNAKAMLKLMGEGKL